VTFIGSCRSLKSGIPSGSDDRHDRLVTQGNGRGDGKGDRNYPKGIIGNEK
jgi:hypothetical protein